MLKTITNGPIQAIRISGHNPNHHLYLVKLKIMKEESKTTKNRSTASKNAEPSKKRTTSKNNDSKSVQTKSSKGSSSRKMEK